MKHVWENPEIQQMNRLPMRSPLVPFDSMAKAAAACAAGPEAIGTAKSPFYKSLDGKWKFKLLQSPLEDASGALSHWMQRGFCADIWNDIEVPGTWTLQGYDRPHYTNVQMPFDTMPPNVPSENPAGLYRIEAEIPRQWRGRRVVLHIGSAESCAIVYVNGVAAGVSKDTRLPCEFDITPMLDWNGAECTAVIAIKVVRWSDASFVEDQDQWWFAGIHRSVFLYSTERCFIADIESLACVETCADGTKRGIVPLRVRIGYASYNKEGRLAQKSAAQMRVALKYEVREIAGTPCCGKLGAAVASGEVLGSYDYRANRNTIAEDIRIEGAKLWSSETPNLYALSVTLCECSADGSAGRGIESAAVAIGFKSVKVSDRELLFNGQKVYIHGVNRHEHSEVRGKTLTVAEMAQDARVLKAHNFNAVRTCHYPDDERWYDICDRYGLYVLDEANIENHAFYDCLSRSDSWTYAYMERVQRMVRRDKNHVCVFGWSLGNESGDGPNQTAAAAWLRRVDTTRLVHYEGFVRPPETQGEYTLDSLSRGKGLTDLIAPMYPSIELITEYAATRSDTRPIVMCEYSHAMGNANGSLADYWQAIETHHGLQGGFIWDYIDQGISSQVCCAESGAMQGVKYWKYGGDFGDEPNDGDFCLNGLMFPDRTPKPAMEECRHLFAPVRLYDVHAEQGLFEVENRNNFTPLDNIELKWELRRNGVAAVSGVESLPATDPNARSLLSIPAVPQALKAAAARGAEVVFHADFVFIHPTPFAPAGWVVRACEFVLSAAQGWQNFSSALGGSGAVSSDAHRFVSYAKPALFRALIENECTRAEIRHINDDTPPLSLRGKPAAFWLNCGIDKVQVKQISDAVFELSSPVNAKQHCVFGTYSRAVRPARSPNGMAAVMLEAVFSLTDAIPEYPRVGLTACVDAALSRVRWYGRGVHECYSDRKDSAMLGLYETDADALEVPYIVPQENGSRCDTRFLELSDGQGRALHIQSLSPFAFSVLRYTADDLFACAHTAELSDLTGDEKNPRRILHIDAAQRGVGTGACGPDTREAYRVRPGVYRLSLLVW